jgi:predicted nucleic acid-binding protein
MAEPDPGAAPRALLDACVLYPSVLRDILTGCARAGLFAPLWSPRILAEWAHVAGRGGPAEAAAAAEAIARLRTACPAAEVLPDPEIEAALTLPDPADAHVLAAAVTGRADRLVTLNLRDFPARALAPFGITAQSPDEFLMALWLAHPGAVEASVDAALSEAQQRSAATPPRPRRSILKRSGLPRLAKALHGEA